MENDRKISVIAGTLLLVTTLAGMVSVSFTGPTGTPDFLSRLSVNGPSIKLGALFEVVMAFAGAGISISLYPVLRKYREGLALGAVCFRLMEAAIWIIDVIALMLLVTLSQEFVKAGSPPASHHQTLGALLQSVRYWSDIWAYTAFILGALMYYIVFFQFRLLPRWLSLWGLVGAPLWLLGVLLVLFNVTEFYSTVQVLLFLPIGLQEMVLAVWLIVKGWRAANG